MPGEMAWLYSVVSHDLHCVQSFISKYLLNGEDIDYDDYTGSTCEDKSLLRILLFSFRHDSACL